MAGVQGFPVITPIDPITGPGSESAEVFFVLAAKDLPLRDRGILGSTVQDPYVKWSVKDTNNKTLVPAGSTKFRQNEPNPEWLDEVFAFEWRHGAGQIWRFEILDKDLNKDDNLGFVDVDVDDYILRQNQQWASKLSTGHGTLFIQKTTPIAFKLSALNLPKLDAFDGMSDPYVKCYWSVGTSGPKTLFSTTKFIKNVENAVWEEEVVFASYQPGTNQYLTFEVNDKDALPRDDHIGTVSTNADSCVNSKLSTMLNLSPEGKHQARLTISVPWRTTLLNKKK